MYKVVTVEEMRAIEAAIDASGVTYQDMMQHAGQAVADAVTDIMGADPEIHRIAVLVGPGNNGGDGLVAARILKEQGFEVGCYLSKERDDSDPVYAAAKDAEVFIAISSDDQRWRTLKTLTSNADVIVDALLGIGVELPLRDDMVKLLEMVQKELDRDSNGSTSVTVPSDADSTVLGGKVVVAVDCPSGLDTLTGEVDAAALKADLTVTLGAVKYGLLKSPGSLFVGQLAVGNIGAPPKLAELRDIPIDIVSSSDIADMLPLRTPDSHKGTYGRVAVIAGSVNYTGAAMLAGMGAYRGGAGLVTMAVPQAIYPMLVPQIPEATWLLLPHSMGALNPSGVDLIAEELGEIDAMVLGPGLGQEDETRAFIDRLLRGESHSRRGQIGFVASGEGSGAPQSSRDSVIRSGLVIDADGLNLLATIENWWESVPGGTVLTPHPGEMARLTGLARDEIQSNRIGVALEYAAAWNCIVLLKGAYSVVASPNGSAAVIPFASDALATAGTGDVLAGLVGSFIAQGLESYSAAICAAFVHGQAGMIAGEVESTRSVMARDIVDALSDAFERIEGTV